jgi:hypothetical protein
VFSIKKQLFLIGKHFSFLKTGGQAIEGGGFVGSWREVAGMTVRKRTTLVVVCGFGALRYMFFVTAPAGMDPGSGSGMTVGGSWMTLKNAG